MGRTEYGKIFTSRKKAIEYARKKRLKQKISGNTYKPNLAKTIKKSSSKWEVVWRE